MSYLEYCGVIFNSILAACAMLLWWSILIYPTIEAFSQCRWYAEIGRHYPTVKPTKGWLRLWWSCVEIGGRDYESISNKYGRWNGVGRWHVNVGETQP